MNNIGKIKKMEFIFKKVKESGTKNSTEQFIYTVEEIGEIAEVLRCLSGDIRKKNKTKNDLASEIGDTLITLYLITKFEDLNFFDILKNAISKEYYRWLDTNTENMLVKVKVKDITEKELEQHLNNTLKKEI